MEKLLDKYFEGATTLAEEKQLKRLFQQEELPEHLQPYQPLFQYFEQAASAELDDRFDEKLLAKLEAKPRQARIRRLQVSSWIVRIAAVVMLTMGGWWYTTQYVTSPPAATAGIDWSKYEVEDPEEAFKFTQMALLKASGELNQGTNTAAREMSNLKKVGRFLKE